jgi:CBS-domain-containing membrane protein
MITDRDICMAVATQHRRAGEISVGEVFSRIVHACQADDDVHVAMDIMRSRQVRRLPVVDAEGRLQGIVTIHDLLMRGLSPTPTRRSRIAATDVVGVLQSVSRSPATEAWEPRTVSTRRRPRTAAA